MSAATGTRIRLSGRETAAAALLVAVVTLMGLRPLAGFDTWWHLAAGREMVRTGAIPRTDPFTFTRGGAPWVDHEWLWQLAAYGLVSAAGSDGREATAGPAAALGREMALADRDQREVRAASALTVVNSLLLAGGFLLGFEALRRCGAGLAAATAVPLAAALGSRVRFQARPEAAAMLLFAAAFFLLQRKERGARGSSSRGDTAASGESGGPGDTSHVARRSPLRRGGEAAREILRADAALLALVAIGANLHPSVLLVPFLVVLHDLGAGWESAEGPAGAVHAAPRAGLRAALLAAATLANPWGWKLWLVPLRVGEVLQAKAAFVPEWLPPSPVVTPVFFVALACALLLLIAAVRQREGLAGLLPLVALGTLATTGIRHVGLFLIVAPVAAAPALAGLLRGATGLRLRTATATAALVPLAAFALERPAPPALGIDPSTTPVDACRFLAGIAPAGPMYNDLLFGGYLDWRFAPGRKTFVDGRMELYTPLLRELEGIYSGTRPWTDWERLLDRYRMAAALVRYAPSLKGVLYPGEGGGPPQQHWRAYSAYLFPSNEWALLYWDDTAMVWLRRGGANDALIQRFGYAAVNPEDEAWQLERAASDGAFREALRRDLERRAGERPPSRRAQAMLGRLGRGQGTGPGA